MMLMMLTVIRRQDAAALSTEALMAVVLIMLTVLGQRHQRFTGVQMLTSRICESAVIFLFLRSGLGVVSFVPMLCIWRYPR